MHGQSNHPSLLVINGFSKSGLFDDNEIELFIRSTFPQQHLELVGEILFVDVYKSALNEQDSLEMILSKGLYIASTYFVDQQSGLRRIEIYRQEPRASITACNDSAFLRRCIAHEIGHCVYDHLSEDTKLTWREISKVAGPQGAISQRAMKDSTEDFCESYAYYFLDQDHFSTKSPKKVMFFKNLKY